MIFSNVVFLCKEQSATTNSDHGAVSIQSVAGFLFQPFYRNYLVLYSLQLNIATWNQ